MNDITLIIKEIDNRLRELETLASSPIATTTAEVVDTAPTDLKISTANKGGILRCIDSATGDTARTTNGWIEDEKYGVYVYSTAGTIIAEFDSAVTRTGKFTAKASNTNTSGTVVLGLSPIGASVGNFNRNGRPIKPSTPYRLTCWVKTNNVAADAVYLNARELTNLNGSQVENYSTKLTGTNDWRLLTINFTTAVTSTFLQVLLYNYVAGNVSDAWFDVNSMTIEEIVTDTTFTGKVAEKIRPVLQAVTSTDNIDNSLDPTGAYANTYALTNAVNEGATHIQTFTPTKKYTTQIGVWIVEAGTGVDWTLIVHTAANVVVASKLIAAASLVEGAFNYFDVPNIWTTGALHFHLYASATTGTPTAKANTSNDLETASFIQRYAKKSEGFTLISNGIKTELKADKDGLLTNAVIDLDNGKYSYLRLGTSAIGFSDITSDLYENTTIYNATGLLLNTAGYYVTYKVNTTLPIKSFMFSGNLHGAATRYVDILASTDNVNWTTIVSAFETTTGSYTPWYMFNKSIGSSIVYIKFLYNSGGASYFRGLKVEADLDTSSIPSGLLYPIGVNQFTETVKLPSEATRIYYRLAKFTNEYGVVMPALEYTDDSINYIGYTPLKLDNVNDTNPAVRILSTTTNYQASGNGSDSGGYILNTGEYMTLTSAVSELKIDYQVGTGTTSFANITKNTLYLSSNAESADSTQDPSHQANFIIGARQQGLTDRVKDIGEQQQDIKRGINDTQQLVRNNSLIVGFDNGTTDDYAITLPNFTGYVTGMSVIFKANTVNTGACTLNINGMGAKAIVKGITTALSNADILALMWCQCIYNGVAFVLLNPRAL